MGAVPKRIGERQQPGAGDSPGGEIIRAAGLESELPTEDLGDYNLTQTGWYALEYIPAL